MHRISFAVLSIPFALISAFETLQSMSLAGLHKVSKAIAADSVDVNVRSFEDRKSS